MQQIPESELILNPDGSIYHLHLLPEEVGDTIITVGDQDRVAQVSAHFDSIEVKRAKREFVTHTGTLRGKKITVISTGIGTDNIDIVLNELDALVNIDLATRTIKPTLKSLDIIRIGTSGTLQADIPIDSFVVSKYALGWDSLMHYHADNWSQSIQKIQAAWQIHRQSKGYFKDGFVPSLGIAGADLVKRLSEGMIEGITHTCPGFYAPQGRVLRMALRDSQHISHLRKIDFQGIKSTNLEMETAGIYSLANLLGHNAVSFNAILANRITNEFSTRPKETVQALIELVLSRI